MDTHVDNVTREHKKIIADTAKKNCLKFDLEIVKTI